MKTIFTKMVKKNIIFILILFILISSGKFEINIGSREYAAETKITTHDKFINTLIDIYGKDVRYEIYSPDELTAEILEHRTESDAFIIERLIGIVKNAAGDGEVINTTSEFNYINYRGTSLEIEEGTMLVTYLIYNPCTNYSDDFYRFDFIVD